MSDAEPTGETTLAVYSDYVCPFCYLGKAAMEAYIESTANPPGVEWRPFDLRGFKRAPDGSIDHDVDDGKDEDYFAQVRENVERLAETYDVEMTLDFTRDVDSWNAQQVALHVRETHGEETFEAFHEAVFAALWQDGRDIGDPSVLADVAVDVGIEADEVREAVEDEDVEARLKDRFAEARKEGIRSIPTFVYGEHAASGAIPPAQFERLIEGSEV